MEIALRNRKSVANTFIASIAAVLMITLSGCGVVSDLADIGTAGNAFITEMGKGNAAGNEPARDVIGDRPLSGPAWHKVRIDRVDGDKAGHKLVDGHARRRCYTECVYCPRR